jgi:hypothetical protein
LGPESDLLVPCDGSSAQFPQDESKTVYVRLQEGFERLPVEAAVQNFRRHVAASPDPGVVVANVDRSRVAVKFNELCVAKMIQNKSYCSYLNNV